MTTKMKDVFDESNEVPSNWVKFNVPQEDRIFGTLIDKRQIKSQLPGKEGELAWVYEMKADYGSFHEQDDKKKVVEEPVVINAGEVWSVGGKESIDVQMRNIKLGQKIGFKFVDELPSKTKGFAPAKRIKVYAPKNADNTYQMDEEWLKENQKGADFSDFGGEDK